MAANHIFGLGNPVPTATATLVAAILPLDDADNLLCRLVKRIGERAGFPFKVHVHLARPPRQERQASGTSDPRRRAACTA